MGTYTTDQLAEILSCTVCAVLSAWPTPCERCHEPTCGTCGIVTGPLGVTCCLRCIVDQRIEALTAALDGGAPRHEVCLRCKDVEGALEAYRKALGVTWPHLSLAARLEGTRWLS